MPALVRSAPWAVMQKALPLRPGGGARRLRKAGYPKVRRLDERRNAQQQTGFSLRSRQFLDDHCISPGFFPAQKVGDTSFDNHRMLIKSFLA